MGVIDDILQKIGYKYEDLTIAERETLIQWTQVLDSNQLDVDSVRGFVHSLKQSVQAELETYKQETPGSWISLLSLFLPFHGLIKKWYQDEHKLYLEARLRNLMLIDSFLIGPKKAREALDRAIAGIVSSRKA